MSRYFTDEHEWIDVSGDIAKYWDGSFVANANKK